LAARRCRVGSAGLFRSPYVITDLFGGGRPRSDAWENRSREPRPSSPRMAKANRSTPSFPQAPEVPNVRTPKVILG
jgi:hypothetical protein